jgi:hypothetical protein
VWRCEESDVVVRRKPARGVSRPRASRERVRESWLSRNAPYDRAPRGPAQDGPRSWPGGGPHHPRRRARAREDARGPGGAHRGTTRRGTPERFLPSNPGRPGPPSSSLLLPPRRPELTPPALPPPPPAQQFPGRERLNRGLQQRGLHSPGAPPPRVPAKNDAVGSISSRVRRDGSIENQRRFFFCAAPKSAPKSRLTRSRNRRTNATL